MKKNFALMLAAAMTLSLAACGGSPSTSSTSPAKGATSVPSSASSQSSASSLDEETPEITSLQLDTPYTVPDFVDFTLVSITTTEAVQSSMGGSSYTNSSGNPYVDVVFDLTNTSGADIQCEDLMKLTAVSSSGTEYRGSLYCVETDNMTILSTYTSISPMTSARFHAAADVPASESSLTLNFDINGTLFTYEYPLNTEVKNMIELRPGDVIENTDYATMEFVGYEFTEDLLPPNTSGSYQHYPVDSPDSIYLVLRYNVTNYQSTPKDIDSFVGVTATFGDKYKYTGFVICEDEDQKGFSSYDDIAPLTTARLYYLIKVPKAVMEMDLSVRTVFDKQEYQFSAK